MAEPLTRPRSGPWTVEDLAGLPDAGFRYEIVDGSLLVSPPPGVPHAVALSRLVRLLQDAAPPDLLVLPASAGVRCGRSVYIPDLVVADAAAAAAAEELLEPDSVRLVVEILSPSNRTTDLVTKRADYATAGIPHYWLVDPAVPSVTALELRGGAYAEAGSVEGLTQLTAHEPFAITITPAQLRAVR